MKMRLRKILTRFHIATLTIAILNTFVKNLSPYSLAGNIEYGIEILTVISGFTLFFFYLRPFKKINFYFSIYATVAFFLIIGLLFRGIFWGLVLSVLLFPIIPDEKEFEEKGIIISTPFQGFMSACCSYQIKERQFMIFEKDYGIWKLEGEGPIDFETVKIRTSDNEIEIAYTTDFDEGSIKKKIIKR